MDPASLAGIVSGISALAGLFGGGGSSTQTGPIQTLLSDPSSMAALRLYLFGQNQDGSPNPAYSGGVLGMQMADAQRVDPLKAAIERMAGSMLPTTAGYTPPATNDSLGGLTSTAGGGDGGVPTRNFIPGGPGPLNNHGLPVSHKLLAAQPSGLDAATLPPPSPAAVPSGMNLVGQMFGAAPSYSQLLAQLPAGA